MNRSLISKIGFGFVASLLMFSGIAFAQAFQDIVSTFRNMGVFQIFLPFILVFAVLYGLLMRVNLFGGAGGTGGKAINIVVALSIAGFIMVYTPMGITFGEFLTKFAGNSVVVILTVIVALILVSMFSSGGLIPKNKESNIVFLNPTIIIAVLLLIVAGVFFASGGSSIFPGIENPFGGGFNSIGGLNNGTVALLILIIGIGLIVFFFSKGDSETKRNQAHPRPGGTE